MNKVSLYIVLVSLSLLPAGCQSPIDIQGEGEEFVCRQTYEFGNYGCVRIEGRVLGLTGQPLTGVTIYPTCPGTFYCDSPVPYTDAEGRYGLTMHLYSRPTGPVELLVHAGYQPSEAGFLYRDSVRTTVNFGAVGALAPITKIDFRLAVE